MNDISSKMGIKIKIMAAVLDLLFGINTANPTQIRSYGSIKGIYWLKMIKIVFWVRV